VAGFKRPLTAYYGENFGTEYQDEQWMSLADEGADELRRAKEEGYRDGLRGEPKNSPEVRENSSSRVRVGATGFWFEG
jgi:hypothetical protein